MHPRLPLLRCILLFTPFSFYVHVSVMLREDRKLRKLGLFNFMIVTRLIWRRSVAKRMSTYSTK